MNKTATFYHAGCAVCTTAESKIMELVDRSLYDIEIVHLAQNKDRLDEAEKVGVRSVPALVVDGIPLHINHGADLAELR